MTPEKPIRPVFKYREALIKCLSPASGGGRAIKSRVEK